MDFKVKFEGRSKPILSDHMKVVETINTLWQQFPEYDKGRENFFVLYLNVKNMLLSVELHAQGTVDQAVIYPREVIRRALHVNATGIILLHNHPSGLTIPSREDKVLTVRIKDACRIMDISVLDHIIISDGADEAFSFQNEHIL